MNRLRLNNWEYAYLILLAAIPVLISIRHNSDDMFLLSALLCSISFIAFLGVKFTYSMMESSTDMRIMQQDLNAIKRAIAPTSSTTIQLQSDWHVDSIPRLLGCIKDNDGKSLLDHIADTSDEQSHALNLVKAQNLILNSIKEINITHVTGDK